MDIGGVELNITIFLDYETLRPHFQFDRLHVDNKSKILIKRCLCVIYYSSINCNRF